MYGYTVTITKTKILNIPGYSLIVPDGFLMVVGVGFWLGWVPSGDLRGGVCRSLRGGVQEGGGPASPYIFPYLKCVQ